jgi:hypothetical protein
MTSEATAMEATSVARDAAQANGTSRRVAREEG